MPNFEQALEEMVTRAVQRALATLLPAATPAAPTSAFLSVAEVAERAKVSPESVREWIHSGKLKAARPNRRFLVHEKDLAAFLSTTRHHLTVVDPDEQATAALTQLRNKR